MILGLDWASVDGNKPPDFKKIRAAGVTFAYLRKYQQLATRGLVDPHYIRDADKAREAGLVVGAYLFPLCTSRATTPKAQVSAFKKGAAILPKVDLPPALDVEFPGGVDATGLTKREVVALLEQFVRELEDQFGCLPMIYTSYGQWYALGLPAARWVADCPLWIKTAYRLKARRPPDQVAPREPHLGVTADDPRSYHRYPDPFRDSGWFIQQFQGDALGFPGFTSTVDINRMNAAKRGTKGPHVRWIQRRLGVASDGVFGPITHGALRNFQVGANLKDTGSLDPATLAALCWAPRSPAESYASSSTSK